MVKYRTNQNQQAPPRAGLALAAAVIAAALPLLPFLLPASLADWQPSDGHKMHFPQLPDEEGWDVNATQPAILADDWRCSETGLITDIHFWGSWRDLNGDGIGDVGQILQFVISIHADIPVGPGIPYSRPGPTLREWYISQFTPVPIDPPTLEAWYDPLTGQVIPNDHDAYFQYNIVNIPALVQDPFVQQQGTIYWLNISAILADPINTQWGWKSSRDHFNDDAVWATWGNLNWIDLYEPPRYNEFGGSMDMGGQFSGTGTNFYGQGWYYYENTNWWNIWFYDNPFTMEHLKQSMINFRVLPMIIGQPSLVNVTVNWSTPEWSQQGNPPGEPRRPPVPPLTPADEALYVGRQLPPLWQWPGGILPPTGEQVTLQHTIPYNPEWVSIDVSGFNFVILNGTINHECVRTSLDLAFVITGPPSVGACCMLNGPPYACLNLTQNDCLQQGGAFQGAGTQCTADQACCLGGTCVMTDPVCCDDLAGNPSPWGSLVCRGDSNNNGADDACESLVVCEPQGGNNPFHPVTYWYDSTFVGYCDFHVRVYDPNPANYTNWVAPPAWVTSVHQLPNGEWWASWWDPTAGCQNALFAPFRFSFDHPNPSTWGDWTVTTGNTDDPYNQTADASWNHTTLPDGYGYRVHVPARLVVNQACCLPDASCVDTEHTDCVGRGGDPQGPGTNCTGVTCHPLKWAQPPTFNPQSPHPECFWGWDEYSVYGSTQWIVADDWLCDSERPVTDIHWWGSYVGWDAIDPPSGAPAWFHIGLWTDVPVGPLPFSHPGVMLREWVVPRASLNERPVACDFYPPAMAAPEGCYRYDYLLPDQEWFTQEPACNIYWVSIAARYTTPTCVCDADLDNNGFVNATDLARVIQCMGQPPVGACAPADVDCDGDVDQHDVYAVQCQFAGPANPACCWQPGSNAWGWKTREHFFMDDAVRIIQPTAPAPGMPYMFGEPIESPAGLSWDMAFVLTSTPATPPVNPPIDPPFPYNRQKNRYVSFAPNNGPNTVGFAISKTTGVGMSGWVGAPDAAGVSRVVAAPVMRVWPETVIHVGDCEIVPVATYTIAATADGVTFSAPLTVGTIPQPVPKLWGDTVGQFGVQNPGMWDPPNGVVNVNDFVAAMEKFQNPGTNRVHMTVVDVVGAGLPGFEACLNETGNIADVFNIIKAFQGNAYPFTTNPGACPTCP
ncbi:MAG: hypothetical protein HY763_05040 [Planctomycetes bacterium]|nr:hypothetical protein [Planctomycetota bacterium]